jgi:hypothetical protein
MNTSSSLPLSARKKRNAAELNNSSTLNSSTGAAEAPAPLITLDELTGALSSGGSELLLVRLPRGLNGDRLHDMDLTAADEEDLAVDGVPLERKTDRGVYFLYCRHFSCRLTLCLPSCHLYCEIEVFLLSGNR